MSLKAQPLNRQVTFTDHTTAGNYQLLLRQLRISHLCFMRQRFIVYPFVIDGLLKITLQFPLTEINNVKTLKYFQGKN